MDEPAPSVPVTDTLAPTRADPFVEADPPHVVPPFAPPPVSPPPYSAAPRVVAERGMGWRMGVALGLIAFLIGVAATALIVMRFGKSLDGKPVAGMTMPVSNGQPPVVILPGRAGVTVPAIDLAALSSRETELATKLDTLEAREAGIDQDAQQSARYATRSEGLMVAFAARRALDRGLNLGFLEQQLRNRFGSTQGSAVATIVQAARNPVTLEDLRAGLDGVAPELVTGISSSGWLQSLRREVGHLVVLRKAGTPSPLPTDRVARAQRLLQAGQVEAALAEVSRTPGASQATRWTDAARRYIAARGALDTIESAAILNTGGDAKPKDTPVVPVVPPAVVPTVAE